MAKSKVKCKFCGTEFEAENKEINRGNGLFCDLSCSAAYVNKHRRKRGKIKLSYEGKIEKYGIRFIVGQRLQSIKRRAKSKSIEFNITTDDVLEQWLQQDGKCFYSHKPMTWKATGKHKINHSEHMSIDRLDSTKGYSPDNIVLCTHAINTLKNHLSLEDLRSMCEVIINLEHLK